MLPSLCYKLRTDFSVNKYKVKSNIAIKTVFNNCLIKLLFLSLANKCA
jgi:hypothetical protein